MQIRALECPLFCIYCDSCDEFLEGHRTRTRSAAKSWHPKPYGRARGLAVAAAHVPDALLQHVHVEDAAGALFWVLKVGMLRLVQRPVAVCVCQLERPLRHSGQDLVIT